MAEDIIELGFEGIDHFATHLHDPVVGFVSRHVPGKGSKKRGTQSNESPSNSQSKARDRDQGSDQDQDQDQAEGIDRELPPEDQDLAERSSRRYDGRERGRAAPELARFDPRWELPPHPLGPGSIPAGAPPLTQAGGMVPTRGVPYQLPAVSSPPGLQPLGVRFTEEQDQRFPPVQGFQTQRLPPQGRAPREVLSQGPPQQQAYPRRERVHAESRSGQHGGRSIASDLYYSDSELSEPKSRAHKTMDNIYASDRGRDRDRDRRRDSGGRRDDESYERIIDDRDYYSPRRDREVAEQIVVRRRDVNDYDGPLVPRAPLPGPPDYGYGYSNKYDDNLALRPRPLPYRQRSSSWSPARRPRRRQDSPPQRVRSKSPNHHRALATVVGAIIGGAAGSRVKKDEAVPNTIATVGGAVVGGMASREIEKWYDRYEEKRKERAYERGEGRERRREKEREREYGGFDR